MHLHMHWLKIKKKTNSTTRHIRMSNSNIYGVGGPKQEFKMSDPNIPIHDRLEMIYFQSTNNEK